MSRIRWYGPTVVLLITVLLIMILGPGVARDIAYQHRNARVQVISESLKNSSFLAELSNSFRDVSQVVEPSVVAIRVLARTDNDPHELLRQLRPDLQEHFRDLEIPDGEQTPRNNDRYDKYQPLRPIGSGSGWVYRHHDPNDPDKFQDYIITNNHVVRNADQIKVRFHDGAEYEAKVLNTDERTDVAVLTVDADDLIPAGIAKEDVQQGDIVFAFGSPLSFDFSMSQGIISATGRELGIIRVRGGGYENFIQTDAMINPGNSGGPLTNIYGEVVGMNTAIAAGNSPMTPGNGTFVGLGFAIPVDMVTGIADRIIEDGSVRRGFLGISLPAEDLDKNMAKTFGFDGDGVLVSDVNAGGPADKAGIQSGDIITKVDGQPTPTIAILRSMVADFEPGAEVEVQLFRNGDLQTVDVTLGEFPENAVAFRSQPEQQQIEEDAAGMTTLRKLGVAGLQDFTEDNAKQLGIDFIPGVKITSIRRNSYAAAERLQPGMIITHVMNKPVATIEELVDAIAEHDITEGIRVRVKTWDAASKAYVSLFIVLQLPEE